MAHQAQQDFFTRVRSRFPWLFEAKRTLDVGSLDINGNNRYLFTDCEYVGIDIGAGNNVDVVIRGHEYDDEKKFGVVISSECFEHDEFYRLTILNCIRLLDSGGIFLFSCASDGRPEHGTRRTTPHDSPFTSELTNDYYCNLNEFDMRLVFNPEEIFREYEFSVNNDNHDLYFWGIKK